MNFATHERFTIAREHPVAHRRWVRDLKSAGDEHAAAGEPLRVTRGGERASKSASLWHGNRYPMLARSPPASAGGFYWSDTLFGFCGWLYNSGSTITHGEPS